MSPNCLSVLTIRNYGINQLEPVRKTPAAIAPTIELRKTPAAIAPTIELRKTPAAIAPTIELELRFFQILFPGEIVPNKAIRLSNGKYVVYDPPAAYRAVGKHRLNVPADQIKLWRAEFLLQRDTFYSDLVRERNEPIIFFRHWSGRFLLIPRWQIAAMILPLYFPSGFFVFCPFNPRAKQTSYYQYVDGSIEAYSKPA